MIGYSVDLQENTYKCFICNKAFNTKNCLLLHLKYVYQMQFILNHIYLK